MCQISVYKQWLPCETQPQRLAISTLCVQLCVTSCVIDSPENHLTINKSVEILKNMHLGGGHSELRAFMVYLVVTSSGVMHAASMTCELLLRFWRLVVRHLEPTTFSATDVFSCSVFASLSYLYLYRAS